MTGTRPPPPGRTVPDLVAVPALIGAMLVILATLPVSLPVALLLDWNGQRRLRAVAAATRCGRCNTLLGPDAPEVSDAAHRAALAEAQRRHPHHRVYVARRAQARCPACGADYVWDGTRRSLHPLPDPVDPAPGEQLAQQGER